MKTLSFDDFSNSHKAMLDYIDIEGNRGQHNAKVFVSKSDHIIFNGELLVKTFIEPNQSIVEIDWPEEQENNFFGRYSNIFQKYRFSNGMLYVECQTRNGEKISISIV